METKKKSVVKLMNNAVDGTTMENLRNIINVKLVSNKKAQFNVDIKTELYATKIINLAMI